MKDLLLIPIFVNLIAVMSGSLAISEGRSTPLTNTFLFVNILIAVVLLLMYIAGDTDGKQKKN